MHYSSSMTSQLATKPVNSSPTSISSICGRGCEGVLYKLWLRRFGPLDREHPNEDKKATNQVSDSQTHKLHLTTNPQCQTEGDLILLQTQRLYP